MKVWPPDPNTPNATDRRAARLEPGCGAPLAARIAGQVGALAEFRLRHPQAAGSGVPLALTERDARFVPCGDMVREEGQASLRTRAGFCDAHLREIMNGVHILPHFHVG